MGSHTRVTPLLGLRVVRVVARPSWLAGTAHMNRSAGKESVKSYKLDHIANRISLSTSRSPRFAFTSRRVARGHSLTSSKTSDFF